jgi:hypothetical protein
MVLTTSAPLWSLTCVVRRIVNWSFEGREVCRVTSLLVVLERSGSVRAGVWGAKIRCAAWETRDLQAGRQF